MSYNRTLQSTLNNLLRATRFKTVIDNKLAQVCCPNKDCGQPDSWEHFLKCYDVPDIAKYDGKQKVEEIVKLCEKIQTENPIRPKPYEQGSMEENDKLTGDKKD